MSGNKRSQDAVRFVNDVGRVILFLYFILCLPWAVATNVMIQSWLGQGLQCHKVGTELNRGEWDGCMLQSKPPSDDMLFVVRCEWMCSRKVVANPCECPLDHDWHILAYYHTLKNLAPFLFSILALGLLGLLSCCSLLFAEFGRLLFNACSIVQIFSGIGSRTITCKAFAGAGIHA